VAQRRVAYDVTERGIERDALIGLPAGTQIWVAADATDMRKGFDTWWAIDAQQHTAPTLAVATHEAGEHALRHTGDGCGMDFTHQALVTCPRSSMSACNATQAHSAAGTLDRLSFWRQIRGDVPW
jgi:hypothetical protein